MSDIPFHDRLDRREDRRPRVLNVRPCLMPQHENRHEEIDDPVRIARVSQVRFSNGASHGEEGPKRGRTVLGLHDGSEVSRHPGLWRQARAGAAPSQGRCAAIRLGASRMDRRRTPRRFHPRVRVCGSNARNPSRSTRQNRAPGHRGGRRRMGMALLDGRQVFQAGKFTGET